MPRCERALAPRAFPASKSPPQRFAPTPLLRRFLCLPALPPSRSAAMQTGVAFRFLPGMQKKKKQPVRMLYAFANGIGQKNRLHAQQQLLFLNGACHAPVIPQRDHAAAVRLWQVLIPVLLGDSFQAIHRDGALQFHGRLATPSGRQ